MSVPPRYLVTRPIMPPLQSLAPALEAMWEARWLTNGGRFHADLERALAEWLDVPYVVLFSNGTLALTAAVRAALGEPRPGDEVITSPYSFVATAQAIELAGYTPRFVDIGARGPNLDPAAVASAIDDRTRGIVPVHCYGLPADTAAFDALSRRTGLEVVYDAAHAFGARHGGAALASHGRMAALSFHATKLFHTGEGGAVAAHTAADHQALVRIRNFGLVGGEDTQGWGFNGKMSELSAALGLQVLPLVPDEIARRGAVSARYARALADIPGIRVLSDVDAPDHNHAYLPIVVDADGLTRDDLHAHLADAGIIARRYFWPLISDMTYYARRGHGGRLPNASALSDRILCLPLYGDLGDDDVDTIVAAIRAAAESASAAPRGLDPTRVSRSQ